jgi:thiol:disulfide interchange protein
MLRLRSALTDNKKSWAEMREHLCPISHVSSRKELNNVNWYKNTCFFFLMLFLTWHVDGQIKKPIKWHFESNETAKGEAELRFIAILDEGWHVYSQFLGGEGPAPTTFTFESSKDYELVSKVSESPNGVESFDSTFGIAVKWFEGTAIFTQRIKMKVPTTVVKGTVTFMVCTNQECLLPETINFNIAVNVKEIPNPKVDEIKSDQKQEYKLENGNEGEEKKKAETSASSVIKHDKIDDPNISLWSIFGAGFLGGLAALLMPCIFPMIPFIVGLFSKGNKIYEGATVLSIFFGLSIVAIYVGLGLLITISFGSDALNALSTNGVFNLFFFLMLVLFAASFLGAFEITLPSSWVTKTDALSDNDTARILSMFFAALTLSLVSFSCTGPIIGTLLVEAASLGKFQGPIVGMLGFSIALALPFTLFSMFPSLLKSLPKSGAWLNSIKVTLGFLELALALKFLSNVDLAYHWDWFDREVFLVLWIIIFGLLGFYLLGKIRLRHDSVIEHLSVRRLFCAIVILAFTLYLIPGLWGAPLKIVSAFLPPQHTQDFDLFTDLGLEGSSTPLSRSGDRSKPTAQRKHADLFRAPHGLDAFFDYEEGMSYAKQLQKPVLIDFTGHACVNCRKMETTVWPEPDILKVLRNDYVLVQLYVDDKTELPEGEQVVSDFSGKKIVTVGNKWSDFQASVFNTNSQPYYVLLGNTGEILTTPQGANYDPVAFRQFLEDGLRAFNASKNVHVQVNGE